jgi:L-ascorbate metabolism protein UlaG (beta-lactamase superfamily)
MISPDKQGTQAMIRFLFTFSLAMGLVFLTGSRTPTSARADEDGKPITIRYHGQSFFEIISSKGTHIVIDPHAIEAYGRKTIKKADLVLMSHFHDDHTQITVIENHKEVKAINGLKEEKNGEFRRIDWNIVNEKVKDVTVKSIGTYHDAMNGLQRGKNGVFILEVDGLRIVHLGDLCHTLSEAQINRIGQVDVLMIPVGGVYTLNGLDAAKVVDQLKPKRLIIPMHFGTIVYDYLLKPDTFLNEMKEMKYENIKKYTTNQLQIDPKAAAPESPMVAVLPWTGREEK